jgi:hypothetical protein
MASLVTTKRYISSLDFMDQRALLRQLLNITNEETSFMDVMEMLGREVPVEMPKYSNFINSELYATDTIVSFTDTSGGSGQGHATVVITTASGNSFPIAGDLILFPSGYLGWIKSVTADGGGDSLDVYAVNQTVTSANLAGAAAQVVSFISNAQGEGSGAPGTRRYGTTARSNWVQIFKNSGKITDIQKASKIEIVYNGQEYFFSKLQHDTLMKHRGDISHAMILGQISDENFSGATSYLTDANSNRVQTTRGLREYITTYGINDSAVPVAFDLSYVQSLVRRLAARRCPEQYLVLGGIEGAIAWTNFTSALNSAVSFSPNARMNIGGNEVNVDIETFKGFGHTFMFKRLPILDHQKTVNFTGSAGFQSEMYFMPLDKVKDEGSGSDVDRFRIRYLQGDGHDWRYVESLDGKLAPNKTSLESILQVEYQSIMGLEIAGPDHFAVVKVQN